ncbi:MAG: IS1634 family transposase [Chlamydiae bacterium]|nr:IS1634 family transposase [Chlamydiota bacterium]
MFIRCRSNSAKNKWSIMVCRTIRKGQQVSQEIVKYLGVAHDESEREALIRLAKVEINARADDKEELTEDSIPVKQGALLENMVEVARITEGVHDVFGTIFDKIGLRSLLSATMYERLKDVVICRIASPASKRHIAEILTREYLRGSSEDKIYRMMDTLAPLHEAIQKKVFETSRTFSQKDQVDVLFFDVTTLAFESQKADELRDFGYSKDHKVGEVQVVLALATTSDGLPIGYTLFPGKTAEVKTLLACLSEWRKVLDIQNVMVVADRAMMSDDNLTSMEEAGLRYIVAAKLRTFSQAWQSTILQRADESSVEIFGETAKIQEHEFKGRRLIVSHSESRQKKDEADRERLLQRLQGKPLKDGKMKEKSLITNRGYLKYFKESVSGEVIFDEEKLKEEAKWDGLHGILTNVKEETASSLLERYRGLWVIEESFRINKHTLEMRPVYHFKPRRIRTHILICYLSFAVSRYVQKQVKSFGISMSVERIREELDRVSSSLLEDIETGERYKLPSAISTDAKFLYRSVGIKRSMRAQKVDQGRRRCSGVKKTQPVNS